MGDISRDFLRERREAILSELHDAIARSGRSASEVLVEAVSKTVDSSVMLDAASQGWDAFAENRPQELVRKYEALKENGLSERVRLDMIGNLQKNKINQVLGKVALIHSISSEHLAEAVSKRAEAKGLAVPVLLEVNVSGELSKSGFSPEEVLEALPRMVELPGMEIAGLMTMAPAGDRTLARRVFSDLRELRDTLRAESGLSLDELSCGMSDDFREAVEEGSTIVRLGRIVFDPNYVL